MKHLSISRILTWADGFYEHRGTWPTRIDGNVGRNVPFTWRGIDRALREGLNGLPGGSSLSRILQDQRGASCPKLPLSEADILAWADHHHQRTGKWPNRDSGEVFEEPGLSWTAVELALYRGRRGLPGKRSLAQLLVEKRSARKRLYLAQLSESQILAWADAWHHRTGKWPRKHSGSIPELEGETWQTVNRALIRGHRGLLGGSSLAKLLHVHGRQNSQRERPPLTIEHLLQWDDRHYVAHGNWPRSHDGTIPDSGGENWSRLDVALRLGLRGLPKGSSLANLLAQHRGKRNPMAQTQLTEGKIVAWATKHYRRAGTWPSIKSGYTPDARTTWSTIDLALRNGRRGLPGGSSLPRLLAARCGVRNACNRPSLSAKQILTWADDYFQRTGEWPTKDAGLVRGEFSETWMRIDTALRLGLRGMSGNLSLRRLLAEARGVRIRKYLPPLSPRRVLDWADAFHRRTGAWPSQRSGEIPQADSETWATVAYAIRNGTRGWQGVRSLSRFLDVCRHRR